MNNSVLNEIKEEVPLIIKWMSLNKWDDGGLTYTSTKTYFSYYLFKSTQESLGGFHCVLFDNTLNHTVISEIINPLIITTENQLVSFLKEKLEQISLIKIKYYNKLYKELSRGN